MQIFASQILGLIFFFFFRKRIPQKILGRLFFNKNNVFITRIFWIKKKKLLKPIGNFANNWRLF